MKKTWLKIMNWMILHRKKKLTQENLPNGRKRELSLLLLESIRLSERLLKMIYSFSKIISSKLNLWLEKFGQIAKSPLLWHSVQLRQTLMNVSPFAISLVPRKDFLLNWKDKVLGQRLTWLNKRSTLEIFLSINRSNNQSKSKIVEK